MRKDLMRQLLKANVQVVLTESLSEDVCSSLRKLKVVKSKQWIYAEYCKHGLT